MCRWIAVGVVSIVAGAGLLIAEMFVRFSDHGAAESIAALGAGLLLFGAMTIYTQSLLNMVRSVNRPADEAYTDGHGVGFNKGWRACARELRRPTVTHIDRRDKARNP